MQNSKKKDIRRAAASVREKCKVSRYGIIDLFKECDRLGYKLIRYPLGENADLGFTVKKDQDIVIFTNSNLRLSREIFTLAHEIGHAVLHMETELSFIDDKITIADRSTDEREQEANYFAACLLMPDDEVDRFFDLELSDFERNGLSAIDIAKLMSEFNVSFDMALNRLDSIGKITGNQKAILDNEHNQTRVGNLLRSAGGNARLNESSGEIDIPFEYIDYVIYNYNHDAIPVETLEKVLECYHLCLDDISDRLIDKRQEVDDLDELIGGLED
ncbi:MAG: ImmA/IrrE family metallo-endopeptidase [Clostridiales bacterium]|nr:ImmA/IrrE family metallo-endopeptidase [Clostridiales bacterium]